MPNFFVPGQGDAKGAKKDQAGGGGRAAMTEEELNAECIEYLIRLASGEDGGSEATGARTREVRSVHWSPYDRVRVVNADP